MVSEPSIADEALHGHQVHVFCRASRMDRELFYLTVSMRLRRMDPALWTSWQFGRRMVRSSPLLSMSGLASTSPSGVIDR